MTASWLDAVAQVEMAGRPLLLRRVGLAGRDHARLEYEHEGGLIPGQWWRSAARCKHVAHATRNHAPDAGVCVVETDVGPLLLQPDGADRRLSGLGRVLRDPGCTLLRHRPERRAVVRASTADTTLYAKIVRPERTAGMVLRNNIVAAWPERPFAVPTITDVDEASGVMWMTELAGPTWFDRLHDDPVPIARAVAAAVRRLHDCPVPDDLARHDGAAEAALLASRLEILAAVAPAVAGPLAERAGDVCERLTTRATGTVALVHRDLYDKQFVLQPAGVGLLDFDTLACGEAVLDVGNLLAHLELRRLQGRLPDAAAQTAADAFLEVYDPSAAMMTRLIDYLDATRLRLATLYAMRPAWRHLAGPIAERIALPLLRS